jgi:hypothetical protein
MRDPTDHPTALVHLSRGQGMMLRGLDPEADAGVGGTSESCHAQRMKVAG